MLSSRVACEGMHLVTFLAGLSGNLATFWFTSRVSAGTSCRLLHLQDPSTRLCLPGVFCVREGLHQGRQYVGWAAVPCVVVPAVRSPASAIRKECSCRTPVAQLQQG